MSRARLAFVIGAGTAAVAALSTMATAAYGAEPSQAECASAYESAQLLRHRGRLVGARDAALVCAHTSCPEVARADCATWGVEITKEIPTVVVILRDASGADVRFDSLVVDGAPRTEAASGRAFELDPGEHVFRIERAGAAPVEQTFAIVQGEHDRIVRFNVRAVASPPSAPLAPPPPAGVSYVPAVVAGVIAGGFLGLSAWLGIGGRSDLSQLRVTCAPACTDDQVSPVRQKLVLSDVALGAGLLGAAVSIYLFARPPASAPATTPRARLELAPALGGGTVSLRTRF